MNEEIAELKNKIAHLEGTQAAFTLMFAALIQTHPEYEKMQLQLTKILEQQLSGGALGNTLTPAQNEHAREVVEWLQTIKKV